MDSIVSVLIRGVSWFWGTRQSLTSISPQVGVGRNSEQEPLCLRRQVTKTLESDTNGSRYLEVLESPLGPSCYFVSCFMCGPKAAIASKGRMVGDHS